MMWPSGRNDEGKGAELGFFVCILLWRLMHDQGGAECSEQ